MPSTDHMTSAEARVIETGLGHLRSELTRLADALASVNAQLHTLTEIRQNQLHIQTRLSEGAVQMGEHEKRLQSIERDMPGLKELRKWVISGVLAGISMIGLALMKLVVYDVPRIPPSPQTTHQTTHQPK